MGGKKSGKRKAASRNCKFCKNPVEIVLSVSPSGKKKFIRRCCEIKESVQEVS